MEGCKIPKQTAIQHSAIKIPLQSLIPRRPVCLMRSSQPVSTEIFLHSHLLTLVNTLYITAHVQVSSFVQLMKSSFYKFSDGVSAQMLKATALSIAPSLAKLYNISISQGRFPECWKLSTVVPIPKSANHTETTNYSKMLERHLHQYVTNHLNEHHPLSNKQWGFQSGKSTVTALLSVTHDWFQALESGQEVCSIFFDLKKGFDSVPHHPLMDKLASYGLNAHTLSWIASYLTN